MPRSKPVDPRDYTAADQIVRQLEAGSLDLARADRAIHRLYDDAFAAGAHAQDAQLRPIIGEVRAQNSALRRRLVAHSLSCSPSSERDESDG